MTVEQVPTDIPEVHGGYVPAGSSVERRSAGEAAGFVAAPLAQQRNFTGRRIDLDLKDADIHNVLRLLADVKTAEDATTLVIHTDRDGSAETFTFNEKADVMVWKIDAQRSITFRRIP